MPKLRLVQGTANKFDIVYDTDWPVIPREGEYIQITVGTDQEMTWKVTRVCHVASGNEELIGTLAWIEQVKPGYRYSLDAL